MSDWLPFYLSLTFIILFGVITPMILNPFIDINSYNKNVITDPLIDFVKEGWSVFGIFDIDPFSYFGPKFENYVVESLIGFSYLPYAVSIPIVTLILFGFLYSFIKTFNPFS